MKTKEVEYFDLDLQSIYKSTIGGTTNRSWTKKYIPLKHFVLTAFKYHAIPYTKENKIEIRWVLFINYASLGLIKNGKVKVLKRYRLKRKHVSINWKLENEYSTITNIVSEIGK